MQTDIHPAYGEIKVTCSCGNSFVTHSTLGKDLHLEVCYKCHPFYTGKQRIVDTSGRVELFDKRYGHLRAKKPKTKSVDEGQQQDKNQDKD